jgi:hypothetical protein
MLVARFHKCNGCTGFISVIECVTSIRIAKRQSLQLISRSWTRQNASLTRNAHCIAVKPAQCVAVAMSCSVERRWPAARQTVAFMVAFLKNARLLSGLPFPARRHHPFTNDRATRVGFGHADPP